MVQTFDSASTDAASTDAALTDEVWAGEKHIMTGPTDRKALGRHADADPAARLGKRERQIMEIVYRRGGATVADVLGELPDPPSYSSVRAMLRYLEDKGELRHEEDGPRYIYRPTAAREDVRGSALASVVRTFFEGSVTTAVAALLEANPLSPEEHARLSLLLDQARGEGR